MNNNSSNINYNSDFPSFEEFTSSFNEKNNNFSNNEQSNPFSNIDMNTIFKIKQIMENMQDNKNNPRTNLLLSLKPYLKPSRKQKVDQYIKIFNMEAIIENFNKNGGDIVK